LTRARRHARRWRLATRKRRRYELCAAAIFATFATFGRMGRRSRPRQRDRSERGGVSVRGNPTNRPQTRQPHGTASSRANPAIRANRDAPDGGNSHDSQDSQTFPPKQRAVDSQDSQRLYRKGNDGDSHESQDSQASTTRNGSLPAATDRRRPGSALTAHSPRDARHLIVPRARVTSVFCARLFVGQHAILAAVRPQSDTPDSSPTPRVGLCAIGSLANNGARLYETANVGRRRFDRSGQRRPVRILRFVRMSCTGGVPIRKNRKIRRHPGRDVRAMPKARRRGFVSRYVPRALWRVWLRFVG
jgi:hypothetical protein